MLLLLFCYDIISDVQMRTREAQFEEDILQLKRQATGAARSNIQENIDLMRLQREVKDKSTKLEALQAQYESLSTVSGSPFLLLVLFLLFFSSA